MSPEKMLEAARADVKWLEAERDTYKEALEWLIWKVMGDFLWKGKWLRTIDDVVNAMREEKVQ